MYRCRSVLAFPVIILLMAILFVSCYKKDIQFGENLADSHTNLLTVDTVTPLMATWLLDSFATSGNNYLQIGSYKDAYLGNTTASTFFQFGVPTLSGDVSTVFPKDAEYDSLILVMKPSGDFYGDTTKPFSISVYELAEEPEFTHNDRLYNTSSFGVLPTPLGSFSQRISPGYRDTVHIRLPDSKGLDFYNKLKSNANELKSEDYFLDYFKGLCIRPSGSDNNAVYGFSTTDSTVTMRLHYHTKFPYYEKKVITFYITRSSYQFNRIITDRSGTLLEGVIPAHEEFYANAAHPLSFTQPATGTLLKMTFPSLRNLLQINDVVRLVDAKLVLKSVGGTFDDYVYKLPGQLHLANTNATNIIGASLTNDSTGTTLYSSPSYDYLFGVNTQYTFPITSYINALLNTDGKSDYGFFIMREEPGSAKHFNRGVFGSKQHPKYKTQLILTLLTIE